MYKTSIPIILYESQDLSRSYNIPVPSCSTDRVDNE